MPNNDKNTCKFCDRLWGVFGVGLGGLLLLIGFDLLSGGAISRTIGKPRFADDLPEVEVIEEIEDIEDE